MAVMAGNSILAVPAGFPFTDNIAVLGFHHFGRMAFQANILFHLGPRPGPGEKLFFESFLPIRLGRWRKDEEDTQGEQVSHEYFPQKVKTIHRIRVRKKMPRR
jgi:hypothetical protein